MKREREKKSFLLNNYRSTTTLRKAPLGKDAFFLFSFFPFRRFSFSFSFFFLWNSSSLPLISYHHLFNDNEKKTTKKRLQFPNNTCVQEKTQEKKTSMILPFLLKKEKKMHS